jgi:iron complex transport system substrate-binding protein
MLLVLAFASSLGVAAAWLKPAPPPAPEAPGSVRRTDATGFEITVTPDAPLRRIVSASTRADQVLLELMRSGLSADRIAAVTAISRDNDGRFRSFPAVARLEDTETMLSLRPDLVLVNGFVDARRVQRLRDEGLIVFDLGPMEGLTSFVDDAQLVADLVGMSDEGHRITERFVGRMRQVAADVPDRARPRGLYLAQYADHLFGGGPGTSYHDVLVFGGLRDAAEGTYRGWPQLSAEDVLLLQPEVLVTDEGSDPCAVPGLKALPACPDRVVRIPDRLLGDPGFGMLEAAERVRATVHGRSLP